MTKGLSSYDLWTFVFLGSAIFIVIAYGLVRPQSPREWTSLGAFSAFVVALFTEMYGLPLTVYVLSGWLQSRYPQLDPLSQDGGRLVWAFFGVKDESHFSLLHIASILFVGFGFILLARAWAILHAAKRAHRLATNGPYAYVRHPQYAAFIAITTGLLLQWPTLLTVAMFPFLLWVYVRLAHAEESEAQRDFGAVYARYAAATPRWIPRHFRPQSAAAKADIP